MVVLERLHQFIILIIRTTALKVHRNSQTWWFTKIRASCRTTWAVDNRLTTLIVELPEKNSKILALLTSSKKTNKGYRGIRIFRLRFLIVSQGVVNKQISCSKATETIILRSPIINKTYLRRVNNNKLWVKNVTRLTRQHKTTTIVDHLQEARDQAPKVLSGVQTGDREHHHIHLSQWWRDISTWM